MLEIFAGSAILCSIAKQYGMQSSLAVDKLQKPGARSSIIKLDLTRDVDRSVLDKWLDSDMLLWIHLAPVCGTASRAREIRVLPTDPRPLRSREHPDGLPDLSGSELCRVRIANQLFDFACEVFLKASRKGILVTMENPSNSYFWSTTFFLSLWKCTDLFCADFQVCMYGGSRAKWTRIVANFDAIGELSIECDGRHQHAPWRFASGPDGSRVWATSLESQYPRKLCIALCQIVLRVAEDLGLHLLPNSIQDVSTHPLLRAQQAQISVGGQPFRKKIPPMMPEFDAVASTRVACAADVPFSLLTKIDKPLPLFSPSLEPLQIPAKARLLRFFNSSESSSRGGTCDSEALEGQKEFPFTAIFGLPWTPENFLKRACELGHPALVDMGVPEDLDIALERHMEWNDQQLVKYRTDWCKHWLKRATELEALEKADRVQRPPHIRENTAGKRLLLTQEMLESIQYEDMDALKFLRTGATLAGEIEKCGIFEQQFKPCLMTIEQLESGASKRNQAVLAMTTSSGDPELDRHMLAETQDELAKGWARGPYKLEDLPVGAVISRRFPLAQSNKTRMIDDFSISGVNDSCVTHCKIDLHMIDTLGAAVRKFFRNCKARGLDSSLVGKTFDLKSAYRQVPISEVHLKYAFFSVYNHCKDCAEIYQLVTLPFGATHSVYCFLRLARLLHSLAARGLYLINTNFYDDFVMLSRPASAASSDQCTELLFMLTGWLYAKEGKKATSFSSICRALGVEFDFSRSEYSLMLVSNTAQRKQDLVAAISEAVQRGSLTKQEALVLRGRLGFADSFIHGRLGKLALKKLIEHAYSRQKELGTDTKSALLAMRARLESDNPMHVTDCDLTQWFVYTDASYNADLRNGGLGAVLVNDSAAIVEWFGISLNSDDCEAFGANFKETIIYELELLATVLALAFWKQKLQESLTVWFGDNDSVRFSLIRASGTGPWAEALMQCHLEIETSCNTKSWFARVPTEANLSDYPSRQCEHPLLLNNLCKSSEALEKYIAVKSFVMGHVRTHGMERGKDNRGFPHGKRKSDSSIE